MLTESSMRQLKEEERRRHPDRIDRHLTAKILGVTTRTLQRWNESGFGPQRMNWPEKKPIRYSRTEVEQWGAANGYRSVTSSHLETEILEVDHEQTTANGHYEIT